MHVADISHLSKEILTSKAESAMVLGMPWTELLPEDRMVRLLMVHPDQTMDAKARVFLVFMHELTCLTLTKDGKPVKHLSPDQIDINDTVFQMDGATYGIARRMTAPWSFFLDTHEF